MRTAFGLAMAAALALVPLRQPQALPMEREPEAVLLDLLPAAEESAPEPQTADVQPAGAERGDPFREVRLPAVVTEDMLVASGKRESGFQARTFASLGAGWNAYDPDTEAMRAELRAAFAPMWGYVRELGDAVWDNGRFDPGGLPQAGSGEPAVRPRNEPGDYLVLRMLAFMRNHPVALVLIGLAFLSLLGFRALLVRR